MIGRDVIFNEIKNDGGVKKEVKQNVEYEHVSSDDELSDDDNEQIQVRVNSVPNRKSCSPDAKLEDIQEADSEAEEPTGNPIRRSTRSKSVVERLGIASSNMSYALSAENYVDNTPNSYSDAMSSDDSSKWKRAMDQEMHALEKNETWTLVKLPENRRAISNKWVFKIKTDEAGNVLKLQQTTK